jgi:hypothetical protein
MVRRPGNAPELVRRLWVYRPARLFSDYRRVQWLRDVESHHDEEAYETSQVLNLPAIAMVDRHGFAPCSPACEAGDLLNDRAAQENGCPSTGSGQFDALHRQETSHRFRLVAEGHEQAPRVELRGLESNQRISGL